MSALQEHIFFLFRRLFVLISNSADWQIAHCLLSVFVVSTVSAIAAVWLQCYRSSVLLKS